MNCVLFAKMNQVFSLKKESKKILEKSVDFVSPEKWEAWLSLRKDIIDLQLYYSDRVTLAMTFENGFRTHSQALSLMSMLTLTLGVNKPLIYKPYHCVIAPFL